MLMRQAALQMLRKPHGYHHYIEYELIQTGESYESYCYNVFHGNVWGDDLIATIIGDMWNVAVSIVSPISSKPLPLFHDKAVPDIVIFANGGNWLAGKRASTHFSAT